MGHIFEELIRRSSEQSNETAGGHFNRREVIRLILNVLLNEDKTVLTEIEPCAVTDNNTTS